MRLFPLWLMLLTLDFPHETSSACDNPPSLSISPRSPFRYQGEDLNMSCKAIAPPGLTLDKAVLRLMTLDADRTMIECPSSISFRNSTCIVINSTSGILIPAKRTYHDIEYICNLAYPECETPIKSYTLVAVDNKPTPVDNVSCIIHNWETITCVLDLGQFYRHDIYFGMRIDVVMRKRWSPRQLTSSKWLRCPNLTFVNETIRDTVTCSWESGILTPGVYEFRVNVTNSYRKDSVSSGLHTSVFVKPDPVTNVVVRNKNSTAITLDWTHAVHGDVTYEVVNTPSSTSCGSVIPQRALTNLTSVTMTDLKAFTDYILTITSFLVTQSNTGPYISYPKTIDVTTKADVPQSNPDLDPGSFYVDMNSSEFELYWQPTNPCQQNGPDFKYVVTISYDNGTEEHLERMPEDFTAYIPIDSSDTFRVQLQACNSVGCSREQASFLIFSSNRPAKPSNVTVTAINNTLVYVSWNYNNRSDVTDYTIHWCKTEGNYTCLSPLRNRTILPNESSLYVFLPGPFKEYLIGVSTEAEAPEGLISSGITWNTCTQFKYGLPKNSMDISMNYTDTGVLLAWAPYQKCNPEYGVADIAKVTIQNIDQGNKTVINVPMSSESYLVTNLPPGRYNWWVQSQFPGGLSRPSRKGTFVINEGPNYLKYMYIPVIIVVMVLVAIVLVVVCKKWSQYLSQVDKDMKQIHPPDIDGGRDSGINIPADGNSRIQNSSESIPLLPIVSRNSSSPDLAYGGSLDSNSRLNGSNVATYVLAGQTSLAHVKTLNDSVTKEKVKTSEDVTDKEHTDTAAPRQVQSQITVGFVMKVNTDNIYVPENQCLNAEQQSVSSTGDYVTAEQHLTHYTDGYVTEEQLSNPGNKSEYVRSGKQPPSAYVTGVQQLTQNTDGYVTGVQQLTHNTDGHVTGVQQLTHTTDQCVTAYQQLSQNPNGFVTTDQQLTHNINGNVIGEQQLTHSTDGYVTTQQQLTQNTCGYVTEAQLSKPSKTDIYVT